ncbi:hypothetical protein GCM10023074_47570 [Microbispora amethystogenes]|uniref:Uncharacterized protein n=1 Tax=Microbispora amethystogenes TaxID=1427754 RepID=A0ABQ4FG14_9ACTN|nr:hypothetical protein Mam01_39200 [Microbispora amethystogenes]
MPTQVILYYSTSSSAISITYSCAAGYHVNPPQPVVRLYSACERRVYLNQYSDGSGWAYCVNPWTASSIPAGYQYPGRVAVGAVAVC